MKSGRGRAKPSSRFRMQRLDDFYYAWGAGAGDFNRDGVLDVVAGPVLLPRSRLHDAPRDLHRADAESDRSNFAPHAGSDFAFDFTGDGWPDVLTGEKPAR